MLPQYEITPEQQIAADLILSILHGLENQSAPTDWVEQLRKAEMGTNGINWHASRSLGAKLCVLAPSQKSIALTITPMLLRHRGLDDTKKVKKRFPLDGTKYGKADGDIIDCLETAAIIAYVQGLEKAMRVILQELNHQIIATYEGEWFQQLQLDLQEMRLKRLQASK